MTKFYYAGNETIGLVVASRLQGIGFSAVEEAEQANVVLTYFTSQTALEDACFDQSGLFQRMNAGSYVFDLSASTPSFVRELAAVAQVSGIKFVECPLMFVDPTAHDVFGSNDNTACFVAGDHAQSDMTRQVLAALAATVYATGSEGSAQLMRCSYTLQSAASMVAAAESDALFRAVAMMPAGIGDAASGRAGALSPLAESLLHAVEEGRYDGPYTIEMMMGEMAAALSTAEEAEIVLPLAESCMQLMELLAVIGGLGKAPSALALAYREQPDVEAAGLDWKRAEQYAETSGAAHSHDHDHDHADHDHYDGYDNDDYDGRGYDEGDYDGRGYDGRGFDGRDIDFLGLAGLGLDDDLYDESDWN